MSRPEPLEDFLTSSHKFGLHDSSPRPDCPDCSATSVQEARVVEVPDEIVEKPLPSCGNRGCGEPQSHAGRPKRGWWNLREGGDNGVWFCSRDCLIVKLGADVNDSDDPTINANMRPWEALRVLNRLAHKCVARWEVTPEKLDMLLERAFAELKCLVDEEARW